MKQNFASTASYTQEKNLTTASLNKLNTEMPSYAEDLMLHRLCSVQNRVHQEDKRWNSFLHFLPLRNTHMECVCIVSTSFVAVFNFSGGYIPSPGYILGFFSA